MFNTTTKSPEIINSRQLIVFHRNFIADSAKYFRFFLTASKHGIDTQLVMK